MEKRNMFVGMDVHKESIDISVAEEGRQGEVRHYGVIAGDLEAVATVVRALRAPDRVLRFVYAAGPCGFGIHRDLTIEGEDCVVVNPSSTPTRSGDRIKTDRRDGEALARLHRAGELTAIHIPTADDEGVRDLERAREDAVGLSTQANHCLKAFLLRQGRRYPGRGGWTVPRFRKLVARGKAKPKVATAVAPERGRGQLRDEPQSRRYPTRGYQQRQPSLERGVADQTDLKNEAPGKSGHRGALMTTMRRDRSAHVTEDSHVSAMFGGAITPR